MKYKKAQNVLPQHIIELVQEYTDGGYVYIPRKNQNKRPWGAVSGSRSELNKRNIEIFNQHKQGVSVAELVTTYYLSEHSIRRIIREQNKIRSLESVR